MIVTYNQGSGYVSEAFLCIFDVRIINGHNDTTKIGQQTGKFYSYGPANTKKKTGYLMELTDPWKVLTDAGFNMDFVNPKGGESPVDYFDVKDESSKEFRENEACKQKRANTFKPSEINTSDYAAIYFVGGHGGSLGFAGQHSITGFCKRS